MTDPLPIKPFRKPVHGSVELPGSKSITNRALLIAALAQGSTQLTGVLFSRDTELMIAALLKLGFLIEVDRERRVVTVTGSGGTVPASSASIDVGNAGTAARFLTALLALNPNGSYRLDGDPAMRQRPMRALLDALESQGAELRYGGETGHFPFELRTRGLRGGTVRLDAAASSQFVSALLMVAPHAAADLDLHASSLRLPFIHITLRMMEQFGVPVQAAADGSITIPGRSQFTSPGIYSVEPDVSAASYFMALPLVTGGEVLLRDLPTDPMQGDRAFVGIIRDLGATIARTEAGWSISATTAAKQGMDRDFSRFSDTFLTLAAIAPLLEGPTRIEGIRHTRAQETDRIAAMATELRKLGCRIETTDDSLTIHPDPEALRATAKTGVVIDTYEDHRVAMSFAILGSLDLREDHQPWLQLRDPLCCRKTFPEFFDRLAELRASSGT